MFSSSPRGPGSVSRPLPPAPRTRRPRPTAGSSRPATSWAAASSRPTSGSSIPTPPRAVTVTLAFHRSVSSGDAAEAPVSSDPIVLAPRETRFFSDVTLATVPAGDGKVGALEWQSSAPIMGFGRIYTFTDTATFGFDLPAIPAVGVDGGEGHRRRQRERAPDVRHELRRRELPHEPRHHQHLRRRRCRSRSASSTRRPPRSTAARSRYSVAPGSLLRLLGVLVTWSARRSRTACASPSRSRRARRSRRAACSRGLHARQPHAGRVRVRGPAAERAVVPQGSCRWRRRRVGLRRHASRCDRPYPLLTAPGSCRRPSPTGGTGGSAPRPARIPAASRSARSPRARRPSRSARNGSARRRSSASAGDTVAR